MGLISATFILIMLNKFLFIPDAVSPNICKAMCSRIDHDLRDHDFDFYEKTRLKDEVLSKAVAERLKGETDLLETFGLSGEYTLRDFWTCHKYLPGHSLRSHVDGSRHGSVLSVLVYLNDDFSGGQTIFRQSFASPVVEASIEPLLGSILVLRQNAWHSAEEVLSGVKYIARTDIFVNACT